MNDIYAIIPIVLNLVAIVFMVFQYRKDRGNQSRQAFARNELIAVILLSVAVIVQLVAGLLPGKH